MQRQTNRPVVQNKQSRKRPAEYGNTIYNGSSIRKDELFNKR